MFSASSSLNKYFIIILDILSISSHLCNTCIFLWQFGHIATVLYIPSGPFSANVITWCDSRYGLPFLFLNGASLPLKSHMQFALSFVYSAIYWFLSRYVVFTSLVYTLSVSSVLALFLISATLNFLTSFIFSFSLFQCLQYQLLSV